MRKIDLIALDLDGTLLDPVGRVTQSAKEAIAQAKEAGVQVLLATGRAAPEAAWFAQTGPEAVFGPGDRTDDLCRGGYRIGSILP